jgi:hypothetical protein
MVFRAGRGLKGQVAVVTTVGAARGRFAVATIMVVTVVIAITMSSGAVVIAAVRRAVAVRASASGAAGGRAHVRMGRAAGHGAGVNWAAMGHWSHKRMISTEFVKFVQDGVELVLQAGNPLVERVGTLSAVRRTGHRSARWRAKVRRWAETTRTRAASTAAEAAAKGAGRRAVIGGATVFWAAVATVTWSTVTWSTVTWSMVIWSMVIWSTVAVAGSAIIAVAVTRGGWVTATRGRGRPVVAGLQLGGEFRFAGFFIRERGGGRFTFGCWLLSHRGGRGPTECRGGE